jgi:hypothetical protein
MISAKQLQELGFKFDYSEPNHYDVYKLYLPEEIVIEVTNDKKEVKQIFELEISKSFALIKQLNYHELEQLIKLLTYEVKNEIEKI